MLGEESWDAQFTFQFIPKVSGGVEVKALYRPLLWKFSHFQYLLEAQYISNFLEPGRILF